MRDEMDGQEDNRKEGDEMNHDTKVMQLQHQEVERTFDRTVSWMDRGGGSDYWSAR